MSRELTGRALTNTALTSRNLRGSGSGTSMAALLAASSTGSGRAPDEPAVARLTSTLDPPRSPLAVRDHHRLRANHLPLTDRQCCGVEHLRTVWAQRDPALFCRVVGAQDRVRRRRARCHSIPVLDAAGYPPWLTAGQRNIRLPRVTNINGNGISVSAWPGQGKAKRTLLRVPGGEIERNQGIVGSANHMPTYSGGKNRPNYWLAGASSSSDASLAGAGKATSVPSSSVSVTMSS